MEKYSNYAKTCDAVEMIEAGLAMHARSQGFFVNAQMDMRRLQKVNREFERRAFEAIADAQKLKDRVAAVEEALEASKLKHAELESLVEQLTSSNQDLTVEVHLCQSEKIASTVLEKANKERVELKAQVEGLTSEAAGLRQQLEGASASIVEEYISHFHETVEYDGLGMYWRGVTYNEVFKRLAELYPKLDLTFIRDKFIPAEPSIPTDEESAYREDVD
ncbi:Hypothetical predicted protein [Olea europaea subsp. europaea]|uniref:Uncharacterized protein n=1 Tax=Olea europaea subsp. europaea TaxID=158383 RepID=A0A8S0TCU5_OLEEU|nr:Hypothetical predicted protein [Olea europaea subsp. europaea]